MPGFISRSVGHGQGDHWVDIVYWQNRADAVRAAQRITSTPAMQEFENLMISQTVQMHHFTIENANEACDVKQKVGS